MPRRRTASPVRTVGAATAAMLVAAWPPFLVAVLAIPMTGIGMNSAIVAAGVAIFFTLACVLSPLGGVLVSRFGPSGSLRVVAAASAGACVLIAAAPSTGVVLSALGIIGALNALVQPATNAMISRGVPARHRGLSFGVVQASIPLTVVAASALVPMVMGSGTWRVAFIVAATAALLTVLLVPSVDAGTSSHLAARRIVRNEWRGAELAVLAGAAAGAASAATALGALAAASGAGLGLDADSVARSIAVMGLACAALRALAGRAAALHPAAAAPTGLIVMAVLFLIGAAGFAVLALSDSRDFGLGVLLAYGFGWAWTGVLNLVVSTRVTDVARATGRTQIGVFAGCAVGPLLFTAIAGTDAAMQLSWAVAALLLLIAVASAAGLWIRESIRPD